MSTVERAASEPAGLQGSGLLRWLPILLILAAIAGVLLVLPSIGRDEAGRAFYNGQLGGSSLFRIDSIYARIVPFVVGASIGLALLQRERRRKEDADSASSVRRHGLTEVLTHWLNGLGIILGIITAAWLLRWLHAPFSLQAIYILHFIAAGMILAAVAHHLTYQLVGGGMGLIPRSRADVKDAVAETVAYTGVYRGMRGVFGIQLPVSLRRPLQRALRRFNLAPDPPAKYLATEKVLSYPVWALLIGIVVITGLIKTLGYIYPLPGGLRGFVTTLHDGSTIFLLIFIGFHLAPLLLVPRNWALLKSMFTTRIARAYVREHLPEWHVE